jgi:hypothetical protein
LTRGFDTRPGLTGAACYGGRSGGVFGTLTYPRLIMYYRIQRTGYGQLASHIGGPWCPRIQAIHGW